MTAHPPPVPPDQRPKLGPPGAGATDASVAKDPVRDKPGSNPAQQGQTGNAKQNTTNKGLQQDR
jgi:hypothetical protein